MGQKKHNTGMPLMGSMDPLEEERFKKKNSDFIKQLLNELHFDREELESVLLIYHVIKLGLAPNEPGINRHQLQDILHAGFDMTDIDLTERVINAIDRQCGLIIDMTFWAKMLSLFLKGTFEEKVRHCFRVYDERDKGLLPKDTVAHLMKQSLITQRDEDAEEIVKDFVSILVSRLDVDRDGIISYRDFFDTVSKEPLLMESMGQCLPSRHAVQAFLTTFAPYIGKL